MLIDLDKACEWWEKEFTYPTMTGEEISWYKDKVEQFRKAMSKPIIEDAQFETFWSLYQKKVDKLKCQKLWAKLSQKDKEACMAYVPLYVRNTPDRQYRQDPARFLRNKKWNDELITPDNGTDKRTLNHQAQLAGSLSRIKDLLSD